MQEVPLFNLFLTSAPPRKRRSHPDFGNLYSVENPIGEKVVLEVLAVALVVLEAILVILWGWLW